ncbi:TPA: hypothetical protein LY969_002178 [Enterococcus faecium]|nr:hypothetical protein [Enterococcus faecium]HBM7122442.1 hypothetical protein [Enterococcus faecium]
MYHLIYSWISQHDLVLVVIFKTVIGEGQEDFYQDKDVETACGIID